MTIEHNLDVFDSSILLNYCSSLMACTQAGLVLREDTDEVLVTQDKYKVSTY